MFAGRVMSEKSKALTIPSNPLTFLLFSIVVFLVRVDRMHIIGRPPKLNLSKEPLTHSQACSLAGAVAVVLSIAEDPRQGGYEGQRGAIEISHILFRASY